MFLIFYQNFMVVYCDFAHPPAKLWHLHCGAGGESHGLPDAGLLRPRAQGGLRRVQRGRGEDHGAAAQVLLQ